MGSRQYKLARQGQRRPCWLVTDLAGAGGGGVTNGAGHFSPLGSFGIGGGEPISSNPPVTCLTLAAGYTA